jgi:hypothetical protein
VRTMVEEPRIFWNSDEDEILIVGDILRDCVYRSK